MTRFQFVADHTHAFEVKRLCQVVQVARSSYYAWVNAGPARAARAHADAELAAGEAGVAGAAHPVAAATRQVAPTSAVTARETRWQVMRKFL